MEGRRGEKEERENPLHFYKVAMACDRDGSISSGLVPPVPG